MSGIIRGLSRRFPEQYRKGRATSALAQNAFGRMFNWAVGLGGIVVRVSAGGGLEVNGAALRVPNEYWSFGYRQTGTTGEQFKVYAGRLNFHGNDIFEIAETDLVLTGGPTVWVFAWAELGDWTDNGIDVAASLGGTEPKTDNATFRATLYELAWDGTRYGRPYVRQGGHDVQIMAATRSS